uniref:Inner membrane protein YrbG, predicted calcium/sodium:proton antiporter n=1 Tax=uncultured Thiotrichaceae bacterium TaxID=298394 RepID=A0A6S6S3G9_9GAMM|nr:MAG: Inner membrane protein YrbG, predicted calcium/sodium:proton antiporter [uncultured Thiotrichaceae bacterium]
MLISIAAIIIGLIILAWSSDKFVDGASGLARITGIPPLVIGMVIIGFGTSAPEMLVSISAALNGTPAMALGNAIGSNIANIALILGITAMLVALPVQSTIVKREIPLVLLAGIFSWWLIRDGSITRVDGILLIIALFVLLGWMTYAARQQHDPTFESEVNTTTKEGDLTFKQALFWTLAGLVLLVISSKILVFGATDIAKFFGISDLVIGLTIVAIGTSLPELAASVSSARKGEVNLAVGNIIGSNLFNNLGVMGLAAILAPFSTPEDVLARDLPIMLILTVLVVVFTFTPPKRNIISRWEASVLLSIFLAYQLLLYYQSA